MRLKVLRTLKAKTLLDEFERIQRRIGERAHEIFRTRGRALGAALDDWLAAERQTIWKPAIEISRKDNSFIIEAAVAGVESKDLNIQVTPDTLLIRADTDHAHSEKQGIVYVCEFEPGQLFRLIKVPSPIDPGAVKAEYHNGLLRITAAIAAKKQAKKVEIRAA